MISSVMHGTNNLDEYRQQVSRLANGSMGELFLNGGTENASIVIKEIFNRVQSNIDIYAGRLAKEIYDETMFNCLLDDKGIAPENIRVLLSEAHSEDRNSELIAHLIKKGIPVQEFDETGSHVTIGDGRMFRFEYDHDKKKAICAFGSKDHKPTRLDELINSFELIWQEARPLKEPSLSASV